MDSNQLAILDDIQGILDSGSEPYRKALNRKIHVVDVSYGALKASAPRLSKKQHIELMGLFANSFITKDSTVAEAVQYLVDTKGARTRFVWDISTGDAAIIGGSYETVQSNISAILKSASTSAKGRSLKTFLGSADNKTLVNIGHIAGPNDSTSSPLELELKDIIELLPKLGSKYIESRVKVELQRLHSLHKAEVIYKLNRSSIFGNMSEGLANLVVTVTVQSATLNNLYSQDEKRIIDRVKLLLNSPTTVERLLLVKGSNSIVEDIAEKIAVSLGGIKTAGSTHTTKQPTKLSKTKKKLKPDISSSSIALRTNTGKFYSLTSLQTLINSMLMEQIDKNMGDGDRKDILNFRSGRFAASAHVERMSQSREGAITAFYTYMKYPYQTFEPGYAQGSPNSRDPKLLISKSIREIAATKVANRMRSVLI